MKNTTYKPKDTRRPPQYNKVRLGTTFGPDRQDTVAYCGDTGKRNDSQDEY
jgi:hypothetical protein